MIHTTRDEIRIIIYLISYGIFIISTYDIIFLIVDKRKKWIKILINALYIITTIYFTYEFSYVLAKGYIPIHFILFLVIGFLLYYLIRKKYLQGLEIMLEVLIKMKKPIIKAILFLCYPQEVISIIRLIFGKIKKWNNKLSK